MKKWMSNKDWLIALSLLILVVTGCIVYNGLKEEEKEIIISESKKVETKTIATASKVYYEKDTYTCKAGETIETQVSTNDSTYVKTIGSSDSSIATLSVNKERKLNCTNCVAVTIQCNKEGNATLRTTSSGDVAATSKITVIEKEEIGTVSYEKENYSCLEGESITTTVQSSTSNDYVKTIGSTDTNVAKLEVVKDAKTNCKNCATVKINCIKSGEVEVVATSSKDVKTSSKVTVQKKETTPVKGSISFDKQSYTCKAGESFTTMIEAYPTENTVANYKIGSNTIATIERNEGQQVNCKNCFIVKVNCKTKGITNIEATSNTGAKTTAKLVVEEEEKKVEVGTISFEKDSFTCKEGESFKTTIKASPETNTVASFKSENTTVATIEKNTSEQVKCINCLNVIVNCKKSGTTKLGATSNTGATTITNLIVEQKEEPKKEVGTISYDKTSYSCKSGESFIAIVKPTEDARIKSIGSSNIHVAGIELQNEKVENCENCVKVKVNCVNEGTAKLSATSSTNEKVSSDVKVANGTEPVKGTTVSYDQKSYTCYEGESFIAEVEASPETNYIKSIGSTNIHVAGIALSNEKKSTCTNCVAVKVNCVKEGQANITAKTTQGGNTSSTVIVKKKEEEKGTISFDKETYSCNEGESFNVLIKSTPSDSTISNFKSSNTAIASIERSTGLQVNCKNCLVAKVTCKKQGNVKLEATSSKKATTSSIVTVNKKENLKGSIEEEITSEPIIDIGTISYDKTSYTCKEGESFNAVIKAYPSTEAVRKISSMNSNILSVIENKELQVNCKNCLMVKVTCKKAGTTQLMASSSLGAETTSKVTVSKKEKNIGKIYYDKTSYTCKEGESFNALIKTNLADSTVYKIGSNNSYVATLAQNKGLQVNCKNCLMVKVTCKKAGTTYLTSTSSTGAETKSKVTVSKKTTTVTSTSTSINGYRVR